MDILTHTISGLAIGTCVSSFVDKGFKTKLQVIGLSGFGAALPDIDAISLWSGFDMTFGKLLGLHNLGKTIYFSKFWYSHHGFFHSIAASLMIAVIFEFIIYLIHNKLRNIGFKSFIADFQHSSLIWLGFILGFILHLLEDMPTPACDWGGVRLLWPIETYFGGTGKIWWWNNYDIFLIISGMIVLNIMILSLKRILKQKIRILTMSVFTIGLILCSFQIKTRNYDFNYIGQTKRFQQYEKKSKEIQKQILGQRLYRFMIGFDNKLPINF